MTNCIEFIETLNSGSVRPLVNLTGVDAKRHYGPAVIFHFKKNFVFDVAVVYGVQNCWGRYIVFDNDSNISLWLEGSLKEAISPENFTAHSIKYGINGDGIEVKFHSTGYPASYKTIVRNRLFGRQIEWNDKGEVVFDVDLDIPQPWPDAP